MYYELQWELCEDQVILIQETYYFKVVGSLLIINITNYRTEVDCTSDHVMSNTFHLGQATKDKTKLSTRIQHNNYILEIITK
jgi:hypothetical protein